MTDIAFDKYEGAGNDFVMLDNRNGEFDNITPEQIAKLCDRRFGIGGDGLLLLCQHNELAFRMKYYNSDGSLASFCGNGARCICAYAAHKGVVKAGEPFSFIADDGLHTATYSNGWVDLKMIDVHQVNRHADGVAMNTGVPHFVAQVADLDAVDIMATAPKLRYDERFAPGGTNVNFISVLSPDSIAVRTYERGVEGETLACGTGIVASAIAASLTTGASKFSVSAKGGQLTVEFCASNGAFTNVYLGGPALKVFDGIFRKAL